MIPAKFDYVRPGSVDEAVRALADGGDDAKVIAGGQSLLPLLRLRLAYPDLLVDVGGIDELRGVRDGGDALVIGAPRHFWHHIIGSVPSWLARNARCPVIVVPLSSSSGQQGHRCKLRHRWQRRRRRARLKCLDR